ncbi:MAG: DUF1937 family protein [Xanthomonadales bacterium]|nr:DUF1937 family protein [Xanthomonadales bacterium]
MLYLAGPYSHPDPDVRQRRFVEHCIAAAKLADLDRWPIFSPIAHGHALCETGGLMRLDHEFWMRQCLPFLRNADALIVLSSEGWRHSKGTQAEIEEAEACGIPVYRWCGNDAEVIADLLEG